MTDDMTPKWAVELLIRFEQLDAKITAAEERNNGFSDWATRNIKDHELRLRDLEKARWQTAWITAVASAGLTAIIVFLVNAGLGI
jgi:uncharacterized protein YdcH (DUF465 family)